MATLAENLRAYIEFKETSISKFAAKTGMKTTTMSNYVTGFRLPDACALVKILEVAPDLSADYLFGRDVPMLLADRRKVEEDTKDSTMLKTLLIDQKQLIDQLMQSLAERDEIISKMLKK